MMANKRIIIFMSIVCFCSLILALSFELDFFCIKLMFSNHVNFIINLALGVFASGLLVLISAILQYVTDKRNYYVDIYKLLNCILISAVKTIDSIEILPIEDLLFINYKNFRLEYNQLINIYKNFTYFFKLSSKDKLIESNIFVCSKFVNLQETLLEYYQKSKDGIISSKEYEEYFTTTTKNVFPDFKREFTNYTDMIDKEISKIVSNRNLKKYI